MPDQGDPSRIGDRQRTEKGQAGECVLHFPALEQAQLEGVTRFLAASCQFLIHQVDGADALPRR